MHIKDPCKQMWFMGWFSATFQLCCVCLQGQLLSKVSCTAQAQSCSAHSLACDFAVPGPVMLLLSNMLPGKIMPVFPAKASAMSCTEPARATA